MPDVALYQAKYPHYVDGLNVRSARRFLGKERISGSDALIGSGIKVLHCFMWLQKFESSLGDRLQNSETFLRYI